MIKKLLSKLKRPADLVIGEKYLHRWYVIPRNRLFNIYLHKFYASDEDRALHDHPWWSMSVLLRGEVIEHQFNKVRIIPRWLPVFRSAKFAHRLELVKGPITTVFITGPRVRDWGFYCPKGWIPWWNFTTPDGRQTGAGCGDE